MCPVISNARFIRLVRAQRAQQTELHVLIHAMRIRVAVLKKLIDICGI